jgi:hypothetical protein
MALVIATRDELDRLGERMKSKPYRDPVVEAYMPGVDRTLLRENLKLTFEDRARKHSGALAMVLELRRAGKSIRERSRADERRS